MNKLTSLIRDKINFKKHGTGYCLTLYQVTIFGNQINVVSDHTDAMLRVRINDKKRINLDNVMRRKLRIVGTYRAIRENLKLRLRYFNKPVYVYYWSRDCDCVEGDSMEVYKSLREANKAIEHFYHWAEGACTHELVSKEDYDNFESTQRDRVMEAFEDGRNYSV